MLKYRNELKFVCAENDLIVMEKKISHICRRDDHTDDLGRYVVRSLYFDTFSDRCYRENLAGSDNRKKYRIRVYNNDTSVIKLECKYSIHGRKAKESCTISRHQCEALMKGEVPEASSETQELLQRFILERQLELLKPKVIVEYIRTPYVYPIGNVRITFDRKIRSSPDIRNFLEERVVGCPILPGDISVLEVKYDDVLPGAILQLLTSDGKLNRSSFSKYALCRLHNIG